MPLLEQWATPDDFATLFQYFWHKDFPIQYSKSIGASRTDWNIHTGIIVRNIADLMGLFARFESGGRKDAILRSSDGDEIAIEWEWEGVWGNELDKLKSSKKIWSPNKDRLTLKYSVLITYTHTPNIQKVYDHVSSEWEGAQWPLLLILIDLEESKKFYSGKDFKNLRMSIFDKKGRHELRKAPAFPWNVEAVRWYKNPSE